jgi:hypothetical protein
MRKSHKISLAFTVLSIFSALILFSVWLHNNPPEVRNYVDPALFMWAFIPLLLLFMAVITKPNGKHSRIVHITRTSIVIFLTLCLAIIIFMFIAANSL